MITFNASTSGLLHSISTGIFNVVTNPTPPQYPQLISFLNSYGHVLSNAIAIPTTSKYSTTVPFDQRFSLNATEGLIVPLGGEPRRLYEYIRGSARLYPSRDVLEVDYIDADPMEESSKKAILGEIASFTNSLYDSVQDKKGLPSKWHLFDVLNSSSTPMMPLDEDTIPHYQPLIDHLLQPKRGLGAREMMKSSPFTLTRHVELPRLTAKAARPLFEVFYLDLLRNKAKTGCYIGQEVVTRREGLIAKNPNGRYRRGILVRNGIQIPSDKAPVALSPQPTTTHLDISNHKNDVSSTDGLQHAGFRVAETRITQDTWNGNDGPGECSGNGRSDKSTILVSYKQQGRFNREWLESFTDEA